MLIYALDDERLLLNALKRCIEEEEPAADIHCFQSAVDALEEMDRRKAKPDVVFLDIEMPEMTGIELAKEIKERSPKTNLIFVTGFAQYALEAMELHSSGYILKPVTGEKVRTELNSLRYPVKRTQISRVSVQCFGNFEVFLDGKIMSFPYSKAKEILAYLIHRRGSSCTMQDIAAVLCEDQPYDKALRDYVRKLVNTLLHIFKEAGISDLFKKEYNKIAIRTEAVDCDYYRFLNLDVTAINAYAGEYMQQYEWGTFVIGYLDHKMTAPEKQEKR